jgi:aerobic carbon-monoxide dehydrogenase medium subunit
LRTFEYLKPTSLEETLAVLACHGPAAKVIAGGTDLMVQWKKKLVSPEYLVSVRNVPELRFMSFGDGLRIGSATTHRTLELSAEIGRLFPAIFDAVRNLGSVQVRTSATIGGNICNAAPSADTAPPLLVLDAQIKIAWAGGMKSLPVEEFFKGPGRTALEPGQLVTEFSVSPLLPRTGTAYWKQTRRKAMDLPILGVALSLSFEEDFKTCSQARIGLGVAAPVPMRARKAEAFLQGKVVEQGTLDEAGRIASEEASPRTTIRGTQWYRKHMIRVLVKRIGLLCRERACRAQGVART